MNSLTGGSLHTANYAGVTVERKTYPGTDHTSVIPAALGDIVAFANDRLAGLPAPSSCGS